MTSTGHETYAEQASSDFSLDIAAKHAREAIGKMKHIEAAPDYYVADDEKGHYLPSTYEKLTTHVRACVEWTDTQISFRRPSTIDGHTDSSKIQERNDNVIIVESSYSPVDGIYRDASGVRVVEEVSTIYPSGKATIDVILHDDEREWHTFIDSDATPAIHAHVMNVVSDINGAIDQITGTQTAPEY
jgi:hypothetical protein